MPENEERKAIITMVETKILIILENLLKILKATAESILVPAIEHEKIRKKLNSERADMELKVLCLPSFCYGS